MPRFKGTKEETASLGAFVKLLRVTESVSADVHRELACRDLTVSQFGVLEALYHLGPMCQKEISLKILKSSGNMTMVIGNLEKRELVHRERNATDRRFFTIQLTEQGESLLKKIFPAHVKKIKERMALLSYDELREFSRLCRKLGKIQL